MVSSLTKAPPSMPPPAGADTNGRRNRRRVPPLTVEEERALLMKIQEARLLRGLQHNLAVAGGGGMVTEEAWAQEAGLSVEELKRMLREGLDAKRALVERNMPMVMHLVQQQYGWRLRGGHVTTADLLQEGAYALGLAADRFDPAMPNRFLTYAVFLVRDSLEGAIASGSFAISVPASALKELNRARQNLADQLGRKPSDAEMANFFANGVVVLDGKPPAPAAAGGSRRALQDSSAIEKIEVEPRIRQRRLDLLAAVQRVASLDTPIRDTEGNSIPMVETLVGNDGDPLRMPGNGDISELIPKVLTRRQANLVRMACGLAEGRPLSIAECSRRLSLSVGKTKAMLDTSLEKLRIAATANDPRLVTYK